MKKIIILLSLAISSYVAFSQNVVRINVTALAAMDSAWISGGNLFYRKGGSTFNAGGVGGTAPVTSVFGRTGVITAQSGDYSSFYFRLTDTSAKTWDWTTKITGKPTFVTTESDPLAFKLTDTSSKNWDWSRITAKPTLVLAVDTGSMLSPYLRNIDTTGKYIGLGWLSSLVTRTELLDSLNNFTELQIDKTLDSLAWQRNDSTLKIKSLGLTAGSSKITVTPTRTDSTLSYAVDVNEANIVASNLSGFTSSVRGSISLTTTGTSGAATYNNSTGVLNIPQYSGGSSGAYTVLQTRSVTSKDTFNIDLSAWYTTYDLIRIEIYNAAPVTDGAIAQIRVSSDGSTYDAGASNYVWMNRLLSSTGFTGDAATTGTALVISHTDGVDNATNINFCSTLEIRDPDQSQIHMISLWSRYANNGGTFYWYQGNGVRNASQVLRGIQFRFSTGNISKATIKVIGCN